MKPPMHSDIILSIATGEVDDRQRPVQTQLPMKARVSFETRTRYDGNGNAFLPSAEIDIEPVPYLLTNVEIKYPMTLEGLQDKPRTGRVRLVQSSMNLSGRREYFRTLYVE